MTDARPAPWSESPPDGYEFVAVPDGAFKLVRGGDFPGGRCRMSHPVCRKPAVCAFKRPRRGSGGGVWWAYCAEHMYGRWIEDGQVLHWVLREVEA